MFVVVVARNFFSGLTRIRLGGNLMKKTKSRFEDFGRLKNKFPRISKNFEFFFEKDFLQPMEVGAPSQPSSSS